MSKPEDQAENEQAAVEQSNKFDFGLLVGLLDNIDEAFSVHKIILDHNNQPVDFIFLGVNRAFENLTGLKSEQVAGKKVTEIFSITKYNSIYRWIQVLGEIALTGKETTFDDYYLEPLNRWFSIHISCPVKSYFITKITDITKEKKLEQQVQYLNNYDPLTGLFNRFYFETEMRRFEKKRYHSVGIFVCDIDGLKLVNDTRGMETGDQLLKAAGQILKAAFRSKDIIARIGSDEFAVLIPDCHKKGLKKSVQRVTRGITRFNLAYPYLYLSISCAYATKKDAGDNIYQALEKAQDDMHRVKLYRNRSARSAAVRAFMKALEARDIITKGHTERLSNFISELAVAIDLPESKKLDLRLLAQFHDLGKVGIPDHILKKPGPLTPDERKEMQQHSEIGYHIARSVPELAGVAECILKHHEWWNGKGYPLGLKGKAIPLRCRILAIVDAYDAMTHDRPYRKARSQEEALAELNRCSGTQFDPNLVPQFIKVVRKLQPAVTP